MSRDLTPAELAAIEGLLNGKLEPLADLLALEDEALHPIVQRTLRRLIVGSAQATDYRLEVRRHPDLRNGQSQADWSKQQGEEMRTALAMVRNGALSKGMVESATCATIAETGLKRATVLNHWRKQKHYMVRGLMNGTLDRSLLPGPIDERHLAKSTQ